MGLIGDTVSMNLREIVPQGTAILKTLRIRMKRVQIPLDPQGRNILKLIRSL